MKADDTAFRDESRRAILEQLLRFEVSPSTATARLDTYGWDSDDVLVTVGIGDLLEAIERFLAGKILAEDFSEWANALECREDIGPDPAHDEVIQEFLYTAANPVAEGSFTVARAQEWQHRLLTDEQLIRGEES